MADISVDEDTYEDMRQAVYDANSKLRAEQREHDITRRQRDTLQTQCEDMQSEMETETKLNNAALKPSAKVLQQNQDDEMACMAEDVEGLKKKLSETLAHAVILADANGDLIREMSILQDSAETQARHMQQVDAACKAAEAKVQEQRKEIDTLKCDEDLWICPSVDTCNPMHKCGHREPHPHKDAGGSCNYRCRLATGICVKIDKCALCESKQLEEITNRDAVILQYESRAEDREEIINALAKEIKVMGSAAITSKQTTQCAGRVIIGFVGKREDMPNIERNKCRYFNTCDYAKRENHTCTNGGGEYCGVWRHNEAEL